MLSLPVPPMITTPFFLNAFKVGALVGDIRVPERKASLPIVAELQNLEFLWCHQD